MTKTKERDFFQWCLNNLHRKGIDMESEIIMNGKTTLLGDLIHDIAMKLDDFETIKENLKHMEWELDIYNYLIDLVEDFEVYPNKTQKGDN